MNIAQPILEVRKLSRIFTRGGGVLSKKQQMHAVHTLSLMLAKGETLGIVGESGCGKSTLARMLVGLDRPSSGTIYLDGMPVEGGSNALARRIQYVFQDPIASLNPRKTIGQILEAPLIHLGDMEKPARKKHIETLVDAVGLARAHLQRYPHEFSGGQAQRIGIARALAPQPEILVLDEPVSALDVSIQAQILALLKELKAEFGLSYLFISHDLSVVESISDRVGVMYFGRLVELAGGRTLFNRPAHPYTDLLIGSAPTIRTSAERGGPDTQSQELPDPYDPPPGCSFADRCRYSSEQCRRHEPALEVMNGNSGHLCACWYPAGL